MDWIKCRRWSVAEQLFHVNVINNLGPGGGQVVEETHQIGQGIQLFFEPTNHFPTIDQNNDNAKYLNI